MCVCVCTCILYACECACYTCAYLLVRLLHMSAYLLRGDIKRGKCDERAAITGRRANSDMKSTLMRERKEKKKEMQTEQNTADEQAQPM